MTPPDLFLVPVETLLSDRRVSSVIPLRLSTVCVPAFTKTAQMASVASMIIVQSVTYTVLLQSRAPRARGQT